MLLTAFWLPTMVTWAQEASEEKKEVTHSHMISIGETEILDTYLSAEKYSGSELRYISHSLWRYPDSHWSQRLIHQGILSMVEDRSGKGSESGGLYSLDYALLRRFPLAGDRLELSVGCMAELNIGALYNSRNQNNPAQVRLSTNIGPTAALGWSFRLLRLNWTIRDEVSVPVLGLMFSPNYGQSYYEIFDLGNYEHNAVVTTPVNAPSMHNLLTLDARLRGITLRIGYLCDIQQAEVNLLKQHTYTHAFLIGLVKNFKTTKK